MNKPSRLQNLEHINPIKNGNKFSPNLYRWMKKHKNISLNFAVYQEKNVPQNLWVGYYFDGDFIGNRLMDVLCNGTSSLIGSWSKMKGLKEDKYFWFLYLSYGRCYIDKDHQIDFVDDESRWKTCLDLRKCLWCGKHTQKLRMWKETKVIEHKVWEQLVEK